MSKLTTELSLELSAPIEDMQAQLRQALPNNYKLKKNTFSPRWTIKNRAYKHSLYHSYERKNRILDTKRIESAINEWLNIGLGIAVIGILHSLINPIWNRIDPSRKMKMEEEHQEILSVLSSLKSTKL